MRTELDWSAYDSYGAGDAYAQVPAAGGGFGRAAAVCIGNRQCQRDGNGVMCPSFRATKDPVHSTHHRAQTLKAALNGELGASPFTGPELAAAMDLCVGCKGCKRECPNGTDMALLRTEARAQRWQALGRVPLRERWLAAVPRWLGHLRRLRALLCLRERLPPVAAIAERLTGISARRSLPRVSARAFLQDVEGDVYGPADGREVALLIDTFSNHLDPATAQAALDLLLAGGYRVHLPRAPRGAAALCCGRTWLSSGLIDEARAQAVRTMDALWPLVERGVPVIGLEPSCLLMLRDEYYALVLGERVEQVAKSALLLEEFLAREHDAKRLSLALRLPDGTRAAVHGHCHQKAFGAMKAMRKVLGLVHGLETHFIESSCCGMAGSFGYEAEHFDQSMRMAELALLPAVRALDADMLLVANGTSCRHQIRDGAQRSSVHLAQVLRRALVG
ncbi:MAG: 4Fe-4S dicluster domain-containing protein [Methyloversatilis sp.]|uniref:(Fe-S)-binding protein n=1 Tax=Methyloversatilis sp. TaxID=2569862 RepID=UPI002732B4E0|nr:4Fe-4S dicluster domain-containing protein [Methyloversatilis sp.]MDP3872112.1 4Fe-4S dicluster domain-containing protein [Methyloversatilis sp.]